MRTKLRTRLTALAISLGLFTGIVFVNAQPALASWESCDTGYICMYDGSSGGYPSYYWGPITSSWEGDCIPVGSAWNDRASSLWDRTPSTIKGVSWHRHAGCTSYPPVNLAYITHNGQKHNLGSNPDWNNEISSIYIWND